MDNGITQLRLPPEILESGSMLKGETHNLAKSRAYTGLESLSLEKEITLPYHRLELSVGTKIDPQQVHIKPNLPQVFYPHGVALMKQEPVPLGPAITVDP